MIAYLRKCTRYFLYAWVFSLFINTLQLTFSLYMLAIYDGVLSSGSFSTLYALTTLALVALATWGGLDYCRSRLLIRAGIKLDELLSQTVLKEMLRDLSRTDSLRYTEGLRDISTLRNYLGGNAIFSFFDAPWIVIYLGIIYLAHPVLGLTATGGAVVVLVLGLLQHRLTREDSQLVQACSSQGRQWVSTSLRTSRELQSMGMIASAAGGYCAINDLEMKLQDRVGNIGHILGAISASFGILMQVLIFGVGATLVLVSHVNPGVIIVASIIMGQALGPVNRAISAWRQTAGAKTAFDNLNRLLLASTPKTQVELTSLNGKLAVDNVGLTLGESTVLKSIDFSLQPGEIMGLVGPNGAGKTSLCRLILGIWEPSQGEVRLDGYKVSQLDSDTLGPFIGYLPQNVELFTGTVAENIARMGPVDAERVIAAAKNAGAHEMILRFAQGYETDIGEAGFSLSGGQRQRIGLARALYGNPGLVILDEPNSSLDEAGEAALVGALQRLKQKGTTTIMITHKQSLLAVTDAILVLRNGEQFLFGRREEVLKQLTGAGVCRQ